MNTIEIVIEVEGGMATVAEVTGAPDTMVRVTIRDYDTDGSDPDHLDADANGVPCFKVIADYCTTPDRPGFI